MPYKDTRHCAVAGCPGYAEGGPYCAEHRREYNRAIRGPESRQRYNRHWEKISRLYLSRHPLCEECERNGRLTPAVHVHHIIRGGSNDDENLMALCKPCHSRETAREVWGLG